MGEEIKAHKPFYLLNQFGEGGLPNPNCKYFRD